MSIIFQDSFKEHPEGTFPDGWEVEQHSDLPHRHGRIADGAYSILVGGNKHLPLIPPLKNFTLTLHCRVDSDFARQASLLIYFHYNPDNGSGHRIKLTWGPGGIEVLYGEEQCGHFQEWEKQSFKDPAYDLSIPLNLKLTVRNEIWRMDVNGRNLSVFTGRPAMNSAGGRIAFDREGGLGHLWLEHILIESDEIHSSETIWPFLTVAFPAQVNGMEIPYRLRYAAVREEGRAILTARLEGGIHEKTLGEKETGFFYEEEVMRGPYVRVEERRGGSLGQYYLVNGTLGPVSLDDPREPDGRRHNFNFYPATAGVPYQTSIIFPSIPSSATLVFGYDYFCREMAYPLAGGPSEILIDPLSGKILYAGAALPPASVVLEITSSADKKICGLIPPDLPQRDEALEFARSNHYFLEDEPARFIVIVRCRESSLTLADMRLTVQMENVFHDPIGDSISVALNESRDDLAQMLQERLDARTFQGEISFGNLPVGVYHLAAELCLGPKKIIPDKKAFEVLSLEKDDLAPPQASGLPELYSYAHEFKGLATDVFDPWLGQGVNACHYMAGTCFRPAVARERHSWELTQLYRRKWMLSLYGRSTIAKWPEQNTDTIPHCDLIWMGNGRVDLHRYESYRGADMDNQVPEVLDLLRSFLSTLSGLQGPLADFALAPAGKFARAAFQQLVHEHWKAWIQWVCRYMISEWLPRRCQPMVALNPRVRLLFYAPPLGSYISAYKSAYFSIYSGIDLTQGFEKIFDGPQFWEDYPYACGYPIQRSLYSFMTAKLEAPGMRLFPEFYAGGVCVPTDGALVYGNPPYSYFDVPAGIFRKRFLEYAYAAVWFGKEGFCYWNDRGFHAPIWRHEHFEAFLAAWKQILQRQPMRPLRTTAFVYSRRACEAHAEYLDPEGASHHTSEGDIYNTAEECVPFAYEQARLDGQLAGFVADMEYIENLSPDDAHTLILPPVDGLTSRQIKAIRRLHEQGVSLMAFESVKGLTDLFGVKRVAHPVRVQRISVPDQGAPPAPFEELAGMTESTHHPLCVSCYVVDHAQMVLMGKDESGSVISPVMTIHQTQWGRTALFTIPPTVVRREVLDTARYGRPSISPLINRTMALILRWLAKPVVTTSAGKLIGFQDSHGDINVIVTEDAFPEKAKPILPLVTLHIPLSLSGRILCDKPFTINAQSAEGVSLRLSLGEHGSAWITIGK